MQFCKLYKLFAWSPAHWRTQTCLFNCNIDYEFFLFVYPQRNVLWLCHDKTEQVVYQPPSPRLIISGQASEYGKWSIWYYERPPNFDDFWQSLSLFCVYLQKIFNKPKIRIRRVSRLQIRCGLIFATPFAFPRFLLSGCR